MIGTTHRMVEPKRKGWPNCLAKIFLKSPHSRESKTMVIEYSSPLWGVLCWHAQPTQLLQETTDSNLTHATVGESPRWPGCFSTKFLLAKNLLGDTSPEFDLGGCSLITKVRLGGFPRTLVDSAIEDNREAPSCSWASQGPVD